jgi:hypothetical protein
MFARSIAVAPLVAPLRYIVLTMPLPPKWMSDPNWWSAIGTISAVTVAIFGETFWAWLRRPKLDLSIRMSPPDCHKTFLSTESGVVVADCYYFRVSEKLWQETST